MMRRWLVTVHRGYVTVRIPVLHLALAVTGLGLSFLFSACEAIVS